MDGFSVVALRSRRSFLPTLRLTLTIAGLAFMLTQSHSFAQRGAEKPLENFDSRMNRTNAARDAASIAGMHSGLARMRSDLGAVKVVNNPELGVPEVIGRPAGAGFLTGEGRDRVKTLRQFLGKYADVYGLSEEQAADLELVADYVNPAGNMAWTEFEQRINGLPVFRGLLRGGFTAKGELARTTGQLAPGLNPMTLPKEPVLGAAAAVARAAANVGWTVNANTLFEKDRASDGRITLARGVMSDDAKAWLLYFPLAPGVARLAWATEIWGTPEAFLILVDAESGDILFRKRLTEYQSQAATYNFYNDDSPAPMSPSTVLPGPGTQAPYIPRTTVTIIGNEPPFTFNSLGWMTDGTNFTDGNNVEVGMDRDGVNGVDGPASCPGRVCIFNYDPQTDSPLLPAYQGGEATDMFYWSNLYHDRLYLLGFTEAAQNFQHDNFSRGGLGGDRISAEAQDSSGTNNANFSTPPDGSRGRMQMYIFPGPNPDRSSGLDHDVLLHELTHGTSNRLHSNGSGLNSGFARSMGEGWSDFYARALLSNAGEDPNGIYNTGGWLTFQLNGSFTANYYYGIRRFPYTVISNLGPNGKPHNPLTFADIDSTQINTSDGAFPTNPLFLVNSATEVHNAGEVWASALTEVRARFITRLGFDVGNQRVLQFITDGMKLDPANPTFLEGRDSILAAAIAGGGSEADIADIWAGFAARGMGFSAAVLNADTGRVTEAFNLPGITQGAMTIVSESIPNGVLDPGETATVSFCIDNMVATPSGIVTGTLLATGGVQSPSGAQNFGMIPAKGSACRSFTFVVGVGVCGSSITATIQADETGANTRSFKYGPIVAGSPVTFFDEYFDGVTAPALPAGWSTAILSGFEVPWVTDTLAPDTPLNSAAVYADLYTDSVLVSPVIPVPVGTSQLKFRNYFGTGKEFDGGVLEISIEGATFQDILAAGGAFVEGGYNSVILGGRPAWSGDSGDFGDYITTTVNMPAAAAGKNVVLRWRMVSFIQPFNWFVDSITLSVFACGSEVTPQLNAPAPGTALFGSTTTFQWTQGSGVSQYWLYLGTTGPGSANIFSQDLGTSFSRTVVVPPGPGTLYARLWYLADGWQFHDYTYTLASPAKTVMTSPISNFWIFDQPVSFAWTAGSFASQYCLWVGTASGGSDVSNSCGAARSAKVTVPASHGSPYTLHARLWSLLPSGWDFNDYSYTVDIPSAAAGITTPVSGSTLGNSATFEWTAAPGGTQYWLDVGRTPGGSDLYSQDRGANLSASVSGLPASTIYVRLWSLIGVWDYRDYVYNFAPAAYDDVLKAPGCALLVAACGSNTLLTGRDTINGGAEPHQPNSILDACQDGSHTHSFFTGNRSNEAIRIYTVDGGVFLPGKTVRVEADVLAWSGGLDVADVFMASDASNPDWTRVATIFATRKGSQTLTATYVLPFGELQAVRVLFRFGESASPCGNGAQSYDDVDDLIFAVDAPAAHMTSPAPGSTLPGSTVRFEWTPLPGVTHYWLYAGTSPGASDLVSQGAGTDRTVTVSGLPLDSSVVYVRLWSLVDTWQFRDYTYTAAPNTTPAEMSLPSQGTILTSPTVTFQWNPGGSAVTQYYLHVGTSPGANDILSQDQGLGVSCIVNDLPLNGNPIYVRLWSLSANMWIFHDYVYGSGLPAAMTSPQPGTKLSGSSVTFQWNAGAAVTQYYVWAGSTVGASDLANLNAGSNLSATVSGLPTNGSTIYVRLWSLIGDWQHRDYTYTAAGP